MGLLNGILPAIYSFGNQAQKRVRGLLNDPLGALQQQVDQQFPTDYEQENWINQKRGVPYNEYAAASGQQKLDDFARDSAMNAITVWHGSPHKFDKFDMSKIGTGEGAQAYGHGLYTAEAKDVADQYRINLAYDPSQMKIGGKRINSYYDSLVKKADRASDPGDLYDKANILERLMSNEPVDSVESWAKQLGVGDWFAKEVKPSFQSYGHLYKVDIPDEAVSRMLDWDKPLSQQAPEVQAALQNSNVKLGPLQKYARAADFERDPYKTGEDLYKQLASRLVPDGSPDIWRGSTPISGQGDLVRQHLNELGIPGIRYLDGGSRGTGAGTSNYVLFDDQMPRILERNGVPTGAQPWQPGEWGGLLK